MLRPFKAAVVYHKFVPLGTDENPKRHFTQNKAIMLETISGTGELVEFSAPSSSTPPCAIIDWRQAGRSPRTAAPSARETCPASTATSRWTRGLFLSYFTFTRRKNESGIPSGSGMTVALTLPSAVRWRENESSSTGSARQAPPQAEPPCRFPPRQRRDQMPLK